MLALCGTPSYPVTWGVEMYDFSKSGQKDMQVNGVYEGQDGVSKRSLTASKWFIRCKMVDGEGTPNNTYLVGNKVVCFYVSSGARRGMITPHSTLPSAEQAVTLWRRPIFAHLENRLIVEPGGLR